MPSRNEIKAIRSYVAYYVEMPMGTLEKIVEDDAATARLRGELMRVPSLENLDFDTSLDQGNVHFTLTAEEACEENLVRVEYLIRDALARLKTAAPDPGRERRTRSGMRLPSAPPGLNVR